MRRISIGVTAVLLVAMMGTPASAGAHITVENEESPGEKLRVVARDCVSGSDWTAFVKVELVDIENGGTVIRTRITEADGDGTTTVKIRIPGSADEGRYVARVTCIHEFDKGGEGVFYVSEEPFMVVD